MADFSTIRCLRIAGETLAANDGPIHPQIFVNALTFISSAVACSGKHASASMIDAIEKLMEAVRDNETA